MLRHLQSVDAWHACMLYKYVDTVNKSLVPCNTTWPLTTLTWPLTTPTWPHTSMLAPCNTTIDLLQHRSPHIYSSGYYDTIQFDIVLNMVSKNTCTDTSQGNDTARQIMHNTTIQTEQCKMPDTGTFLSARIHHCQHAIHLPACDGFLTGLLPVTEV